MNKVIITAAVTGGIHTPSMSPYLPITPKEIVEDAIKARKAGAAVVHIHVRDPETGRPVPRLDLFREIATEIKKRSDLVICLTTGGGLGTSIEERLQVLPELRPELCSFNQGSMNFGIFNLADKIKEFKFSWEKPFFEMTYDLIFPNTFKSLAIFAQTMTKYGTKPELEIYDVGMINNTAWLIQKGLLKPPIYIQFVMGIMGGIPASVENLVFLYKTARETIGDFIWSVIGAGKYQMPLAATALALGGNVRVGLEDSLYVGKGQLAKSSAEQVEKAAEIADALGLKIATPDDVRRILKLKGLEKVNF